MFACAPWYLLAGPSFSIFHRKLLVNIIWLTCCVCRAQAHVAVTQQFYMRLPCSCLVAISTWEAQAMNSGNTSLVSAVVIIGRAGRAQWSKLAFNLHAMPEIALWSLAGIVVTRSNSTSPRFVYIAKDSNRREGTITHYLVQCTRFQTKNTYWLHLVKVKNTALLLL